MNDEYDRFFKVVLVKVFKRKRKFGDIKIDCHIKERVRWKG